MIFAWWMVAVRYRRAIFVLAVLGLAAVVAVGTLSPREPTGLILGLFVAMVVLLVLLMLVVRVARRRVPTGLEVTGGAFRSPRPSFFLGLVLPHLCAIAIFVLPGSWTARYEHVVDPNWLLVVALSAAPIGLYLPGLWRGVGVILTPDGIRSDRYLGTLTIPWDALADVQPVQPADARGEVRLTYTRPELLRRTGLLPHRDRIYFEGTDRDLIADAVAHYAAHPAARSTIGSHTGYENLQQLHADATPARRHAPEPIPSRWKISGSFLIAALATVAAARPPAALTGSRIMIGLIGLLCFLGAAANLYTRSTTRKQSRRPVLPNSGQWS
ncbi:hypothetical protein [Micromonospora craterilacus]|uniref:hypothetical protein n=1 Tax=Micromonospora craterilacus TaxID=1655439 RepID=UPI0011B43554|nr:hypothetical protein [Micromonospora craterilacus]